MTVPCARAPPFGGTTITPSAHEFNSKISQDHQNFQYIVESLLVLKKLWVDHRHAVYILYSNYLNKRTGQNEDESQVTRSFIHFVALPLNFELF